VVPGSTSNTLTAYNKADGSVAWNYVSDGTFITFPALSADAKTVYASKIGGATPEVLAFDHDTGVLRWAHPVPGTTMHTLMIEAPDTSLYAIGYSNFWHIVPYSIVHWQAYTASVSEYAGSLTLVLLRSGVNTTAAFSVDITATDGSAVSGADYTLVTTSVAFAEGETTKNVVLTIVADAHYEPSETLTVQVSNLVVASGPAAYIADAPYETATVTIENSHFPYGNSYWPRGGRDNHGTSRADGDGTTPPARLPTWSLKAGAGFMSSPAIGPDGTIYAGSHDARFTAIDPRTATVKWQYLGPAAFATFPVITPDGIVIANADDGRV
jgi:outer membrane protein assembly factor BamB